MDEFEAKQAHMIEGAMDGKPLEKLDPELRREPHVARLTARFMLDLRTRLEPYADQDFIPKTDMLDPANPEHDAFRLKFRIAALNRLKTTGMKAALKHADIFMMNGMIDIDAVRTARRDAQVERMAMEIFLEEIGVKRERDGSFRGMHDIANVIDFAEVLLGLLVRWHGNEPLRKRTFLEMQVMLKNNTPRAVQ